MKVVIEADECYPVYSIYNYDKSWSSSFIELPAEVVSRIKRAEKEFNACQDIMKKACGDDKQ